MFNHQEYYAKNRDELKEYKRNHYQVNKEKYALRAKSRRSVRTSEQIEKERERQSNFRKIHKARLAEKRLKDKKETASGYFRAKLRTLKCSAPKRGLEFTLSLRHVLDVYAQQEGKCAILSVPMIMGGDGKSPYTLSIDRVDDTVGYVDGNIRLVCFWYNCARMRGMSDKDVRDMAALLLGCR